MQSVIASLSSSSSKVKSFIRQVRSCNTAAEERALVARESANMRSEMSDLSNSTRQVNISKLLVNKTQPSQLLNKHFFSFFFFSLVHSHARVSHQLWPDGVPEAHHEPLLQRQEGRLSWHHDAPRRETRTSHHGHKHTPRVPKKNSHKIHKNSQKSKNT